MSDLRFISFRVGAETFVADIMAIRQIVLYGGSTAVPGAPSFIDPRLLADTVDQITREFTLSAGAEITLEIDVTKADNPDVMMVMFGANDRLDLRDEQGAHLHFRTDEWRAAYAARADKILTLLANAGLRVIWCGNPIARSPTYSADMSYINDIYAAETVRFGAQFVPLWTVIADEEGRYAAYGKDRDGTTQRLRADDGIHFTAAGYELIAEKIVSLMSAAAANAR